MNQQIDRTAMTTALAKAIAYKAAGKDEEAAEWAGKLIQLLKEADIQWYT